MKVLVSRFEIPGVVEREGGMRDWETVGLGYNIWVSFRFCYLRDCSIMASSAVFNNSYTFLFLCTRLNLKVDLKFQTGKKNL
jgi:hypothetical protein